MILCPFLLFTGSLRTPSLASGDVFPHREQAMKKLADRLVGRLFLRSDIPDESIRILHRCDLESVEAARLLAENLRHKGYQPVARSSVRPVSLECALTVRTREEKHEAILHWTHSLQGPLTVTYSSKNWLRPGYQCKDRIRIACNGTHPSRESAMASALKAARARIIERTRIALANTSFPVPPGEDRIRTRLEAHLPPVKVRQHLIDTFLQRETGPDCTSFKAHLLLEFSQGDVKALAGGVARDLRAMSRRILGRSVFLVISLILLAVCYVWLDGKTRGFLRGPLRLAFSLILLSLVLGALVT